MSFNILYKEEKYDYNILFVSHRCDGMIEQSCGINIEIFILETSFIVCRVDICINLRYISWRRSKISTSQLR